MANFADGEKIKLIEIEVCIVCGTPMETSSDGTWMRCPKCEPLTP